MISLIFHMFLYYFPFQPIFGFPNCLARQLHRTIASVLLWFRLCWMPPRHIDLKRGISCQAEFCDRSVVDLRFQHPTKVVRVVGAPMQCFGCPRGMRGCWLFAHSSSSRPNSRSRPWYRRRSEKAALKRDAPRLYHFPSASITTAELDEALSGALPYTASFIIIG